MSLKGWYQFLMPITVLLSLLSLLGGGLVVPPFKGLYWFHSSTSVSGLYGGCPITNSTGMDFFHLDSNWTLIQSECWYFFKSNSSPFDSTLGMAQSEAFFIVNSIAWIMSFISWILFLCSDPKTSGWITLLAFFMQTIVFGFATYAFYSTAKLMAKATMWTDTIQYFGPGLIVNLVATLLLLTCASISLFIDKQKGKHYKDDHGDDEIGF